MSREEQDIAAVTAGAGPARPEWSAPVLRTLGDLATLTQALDNKGRNDGGSGFGKRT